MKPNNERGTALLICLFSLLVLTFLGALALSGAEIEMKAAAYHEQELNAIYLSEAMVHQVISWFQDPKTAPLFLQTFFIPRFSINEMPSFHRPAGGSQFIGSWMEPDLTLHLSPLSEWEDLWAGLQKALEMTDEIITIKLYSPLVPGALATLETSVKSRNVKKTLTLQLIHKQGEVLPLKGSWHETY